MKRTTTLTTALALAAIPATLAAQSPELGVRAGGAWTDLTTDRLDSRGESGFSIGGFLEFPLNDVLSLDAGASWVKKGGTFDIETIDKSIEVSYVEVPILLRANLQTASSFTPRLHAGPTVAFRVDCTVTDLDTGAAPACDEFGGFDATSYDLGLTAGGGLAFDARRGATFALDAFYTLGLRDINDTEFDATPEDELFAEQDDLDTRSFVIAGSLSIPVG